MEPIKKATDDVNVALVFNNAGYITTGMFADVSIERHLANYECNATCSLRITHHFLNKMLDSGTKGLIAFTSSPAGAMCSPFACIYGSTKAFLTEFAMSLAPLEILHCSRMAELTARARQDEPVGQGGGRAGRGRGRGGEGTVGALTIRTTGCFRRFPRTTNSTKTASASVRTCRAAPPPLCCGTHETVRKTVNADKDNPGGEPTKKKRSQTGPHLHQDRPTSAPGPAHIYTRTGPHLHQDRPASAPGSGADNAGSSGS